MPKEKKKFKETRIGIFLKEKAPAILDKIGDVLPDKGVLGIVKNIIDKDETLSEADKLEASERIKQDLEMYEIDRLDRADARAREREYVKSGKKDWMMFATGITALLSFIGMVIAVIMYPEKYQDNPIFHQLMGVIEGVALTIFAYYYGSSKGSRDKTTLLGKK